MAFSLRKTLRQRRNKRRRADDAAIANLLESESGRQTYWQELALECARHSLIELLETVLPLDGDVIECGVFRGRTLRMICRAVKGKKTVLGLDTFQGFPDLSLTESDTSWLRPVSRLRGKFTDAKDAPALLNDFSRAYGIDLDIRVGPFEDTLPSVANRRFCFAHVDCDTYNSHVECLLALYDRLVPRGVMVFDDYGSTKWPGARAAVDEFFAERPETVLLNSEREHGAWHIVKSV